MEGQGGGWGEEGVLGLKGHGEFEGLPKENKQFFKRNNRETERVVSMQLHVALLLSVF